jgi:hypothetical protein
MIPWVVELIRGTDYKAPVPTREVGLRDDQVLAEGEATLRRIKDSRPMVDWISIGKALLVLRRKATAETGAKKPRGVAYCGRNSALVRQHGFMVISHQPQRQEGKYADRRKSACD